jgi:hypothetical protein
VAGNSGVPVGGELGITEPFEDLGHHRALGKPTAGVQHDLFADLGDPSAAALIGQLGRLVGAVDVGQHLPPLDGDTELVMRQLGGVVDHHIGDLHQL